MEKQVQAEESVSVCKSAADHCVLVDIGREDGSNEQWTMSFEIEPFSKGRNIIIVNKALLSFLLSWIYSFDGSPILMLSALLLLSLGEKVDWGSG